MKKASMPQILSVFIGYIAFVYLFQWLSGNLLWAQGLIFAASLFMTCLIVVVGLHFKNPELLAERFRKKGTGGAAKGDTVIVVVLKLVFSVWMLIVPLDKRFALSPEFPLWLEILGGVGLLKSIIILVSTFFTNAYLSPLVRMQENQKVITVGIYRLVRHPMYLGLFILFVSTAILCGSVWGIVISFVSLAILAVRITVEEKMLITELDGYSEYKKKTRYRLIPFIW